MQSSGHGMAVANMCDYGHETIKRPGLLTFLGRRDMHGANKALCLLQALIIWRDGGRTLSCMATHKLPMLL